MSVDTKHNIFALLDTLTHEECWEIAVGAHERPEWRCAYFRARAKMYVEWWHVHKHEIRLRIKQKQ